MFVIEKEMVQKVSWYRLNPLESGHVCNNSKKQWDSKSIEGLNPLESGHVCNYIPKNKDNKAAVSIPLNRVMFVIHSKDLKEVSFVSIPLNRVMFVINVKRI